MKCAYCGNYLAPEGSCINIDCANYLSAQSGCIDIAYLPTGTEIIINTNYERYQLILVQDNNFQIKGGVFGTGDDFHINILGVYNSNWDFLHKTKLQLNTKIEFTSDVFYGCTGEIESMQIKLGDINEQQNQ